MTLKGWEKLAALGFAGLVSWILIAWVDVTAPGIADLRVTSAKLAPLSHPDFNEVATAAFAPAKPPFWHAGRFGVARIVFDVARPATSDLALMTRGSRDNYAVYVNGRLAAPIPGRLSNRPTIHAQHPRLTKLLPSLLRPGTNTLDVVSATNGAVATLNLVYLGPSDRLEPAFDHAYALAHDTSLVAAIAAGVVLLFALALAGIIRRPALIVSVAATLSLTLMNELHGLWADAPWTFQSVTVFLIGTPLWIACAAFANEWTNGPVAYRSWFVAAAILSLLTIVAIYTLLAPLPARNASNVVQSLVGLGSLGFMVQRLTRYYYHAPRSASAEIFVAAVGLIMALTLLVSQMVFQSIDVGLRGEAFTKFGTISIIVFIAIGLARHGIGIYQIAELNNETLARKVADKERELEINHAQLRAQERERDLIAERGRIMRDVHDGIGSQLLGLLVQARSSTAKPSDMALGLQAAIDDLYLVVDSLDGVDGSLETALGMFRMRIEPKCTAAGIDIAWNVEDAGNTKALGPATVLQIYRILQEALSNAIRHGKPKRVTLSLQRSSESSPISLTLKDDGIGFDPARHPAGRGLSNMKKRAASIGATLDITSDTTGTRVNLRLPQ